MPCDEMQWNAAHTIYCHERCSLDPLQLWYRAIIILFCFFGLFAFFVSLFFFSFDFFFGCECTFLFFFYVLCLLDLYLRSYTFRCVLFFRSFSIVLVGNQVI